MKSHFVSRNRDTVSFGNPFVCKKVKEKRQVDIDLIDDISMIDEKEELTGRKRKHEESTVASSVTSVDDISVFKGLIQVGKGSLTVCIRHKADIETVQKTVWLDKMKEITTELSETVMNNDSVGFRQVLEELSEKEIPKEIKEFLLEKVKKLVKNMRGWSTLNRFIKAK